MDHFEERMMEIRASPAKKQKQQFNMHEEERRSYAAVVRASLFSSSSDVTTHDVPQTLPKKCAESARTVIVVEAAGTGCRPRTTPTPTASSRHPTPHRRQQQQQSFDVQPFLRQLDECIELEAKFRGSVQPSSAQVSPVSNVVESATITSGMRDGSAHVLRCLKVWYDLPSDVFFNAISSIDRFLSKMKVNTFRKHNQASSQVGVQH